MLRQARNNQLAGTGRGIGRVQQESTEFKRIQKDSIGSGRIQPVLEGFAVICKYVFTDPLHYGGDLFSGKMININLYKYT